MTTTDPNRALWQTWARGEPGADWESLGAEPADVAARPVDAPAGLWLRPRDAVADPVILAIHGGGFVSGSARTHRWLFGHLAAAARMPAFAVDYGLVPEHVHPRQLDTVVAAYRWLVAQDGGHRVAVVGDSCGATLAVLLAVRARDERLPAPIGLLLISAWTDLEATGASYDAGTDPFFTRDVVRTLAAGYLAGADPRDPTASPLHASLRGLPPVYLQVGADEALRDDSRRLADRLREAGVPVRVDEFLAQVHTFQMGAGRTAEADDAVERGGLWLRSRV